MKPRPYQSEALEAITAEFEKGIQKTLLVLPTGCGKTIVFNGIAFAHAYNPDRSPSGGRVLVLAHQNLLIDQAADKLSKVLGLRVSREKGKLHCQDQPWPITVSSMQTMKNRLERFPSDYFNLIIIDECHHSLSKSYKAILEHFDSARLLGVTATPDRADKKNLDSIFQSVAYQYTIREAQDDGFLVPVQCVRPYLNIDISKVKRTHGDLADGSIAEVIEPCLHQIADSMRDFCLARKTVCFVPLIKTAQKASDIFNHKGFRAEWISGNDPDREQKLKDFEDGKTNILFNSMLLTEGWDCPSVDCIVVLRPTTSRALYVQMVGRGLRLSPETGKKDCLLVDFLFQHHDDKLAGPLDVLAPNLPPLAKKNFNRAENLEEIELREAVDREMSLAEKLKKKQEEQKKKAAKEVSAKQIKCLVRAGIPLETVEKMEKWQAQNIIGYMAVRGKWTMDQALQKFVDKQMNIKPKEETYHVIEGAEEW